MLKSRTALFLAAIILASTYLPGQAVFAEAPVTATDGVAIVAANGRYGTFESNLTLSPGGLYCYKISVSNLDTKAAERYIYVVMPRYFKNQPEEYIPKLVKIKNLPKSKLPRSKGDYWDEYAARINIAKNYEGFELPSSGQLPTGKFTQNGSLETAAVIRLDLSGLNFKKGTHDIHFIFQAPEYTSLPSNLNYAKHSFYIYEKSGDSYTLAASQKQPPEIRYTALTESGLTSPDSLGGSAVELWPGDFYNYRIMVKRPGRQDLENHLLLVALPAFYQTLGEASTPFLSELLVTGLSTDQPPLSFSSVPLRESIGDLAWLPFKSASITEYSPDVTLIKFDLSSLEFINEEAFFDFYFQVPPHAPLDMYPTDTTLKDTALHSFATYEFSGNGDLLYKSSMDEGLQKALINQNPLIRSLPPFSLQAVDTLYYDGKSRGRASVESRRLEVLPGSKYLYQIAVERIQSPEGFQNDLYIALPWNAAPETKEVTGVGIDLTGAVAVEDNSIKIDLNKARFSADTAILAVDFSAPNSAEEIEINHNFLLVTTGPEGEKYIVTNEEADRPRVTVLPSLPTADKPEASLVEIAGISGWNIFGGNISQGNIPEESISGIIDGITFGNTFVTTDELDILESFDTANMTDTLESLDTANTAYPLTTANTMDILRALNESPAAESLNRESTSRSAATEPPSPKTGPAAAAEENMEEKKDNPRTKDVTPPLLLCFIFIVLEVIICSAYIRRLHS